MILLETSAGKGLWVEAVAGVSKVVETEHRSEIGRDGSRFREMNSRLSMGLAKFGDGRRLRAKDWVCGSKRSPEYPKSWKRNIGVKLDEMGLVLER
jgi:hypothetical protein